MKARITITYEGTWYSEQQLQEHRASMLVALRGGYGSMVQMPQQASIRRDSCEVFDEPPPSNA